MKAPPPLSPALAVPAVQLSGVVATAGARVLLQLEHLSLWPGERVALVGANGAGKSTLVALLAGLPLRGVVLQGEITVLGRRLWPAPAWRGAERRAWRAQVGLVQQQLHLVPRLSALDNVIAGALARPGLAPWRAWSRCYPRTLREEGLAALARLGLAERAGVRADRLSGGERQKVGVARLLLQRPRLLLADEPTSALDPASTREVLAVLNALAGPEAQAAGPAASAAQAGPATPGTLVSVVHHAGLLPALADRVIGLAGGRIAFDLPRPALDAARLRALYEAPEPETPVTPPP